MSQLSYPAPWLPETVAASAAWRDCVSPDQTVSTNLENPSILVTGNCELQTAIDSMKLGAFDYVTKPFELEMVLDRVKSALHQRRQQLKEEEVTRQLRDSLQTQAQALDSVLLDLDAGHQATLEALIRALDARAHETETHPGTAWRGNGS
jgi:FixJ family two-component response regulator